LQSALRLIAIDSWQVHCESIEHGGAKLDDTPPEHSTEASWLLAPAPTVSKNRWLFVWCDNVRCVKPVDTSLHRLGALKGVQQPHTWTHGPRCQQSEALLNHKTFFQNRPLFFQEGSVFTFALRLQLTVTFLYWQVRQISPFGY